MTDDSSTVVRHAQRHGLRRRRVECADAVSCRRLREGRRKQGRHGQERLEEGKAGGLPIGGQRAKRGVEE